jgi:glucosamine--fructose-6-phosphate aminotransferase (isomerizing)
MLHIEQEIAEQPEVLSRLLAEGTATAQQIGRAIRDFNPAFVHIAARGTSDNAGRYAQYLIGIQAHLAVGLATPSVHTLYDSAPNLSKALVIGISQSGQAEDVRRVIADARAQGALTVSITNDPNSPLAIASAYHLPLYAGEEISVAATKTYTAELLAIAMIVTALLDKPDMQEALEKLPALVAETLEFSEPITDWAERYRYMDRFAVIGRGYNYCTAFEISLKIKELCYVTGVEYSEADFRHGPIALVESGFPVLAVAPTGKTLPQFLDLLERLRSRRAECLVISNAETALGYAQYAMPLPIDLPEWLAPVAAVIPGQIFALNLALAKGHSVDKPIGLTKVTITA